MNVAMRRGALLLFAVALLAALASVRVQAVISPMFPLDPRRDIARDLLRHMAEQQQKADDIHHSSHQSRSSLSSHQRPGSGISSAVASSIADQIDSSEMASVPVPYTKKFYLTFGPYYVENPVSNTDKKISRQMYEIDESP